MTSRRKGWGGNDPDDRYERSSRYRPETGALFRGLLSYRAIRASCSDLFCQLFQQLDPLLYIGSLLQFLQDTLVPILQQPAFFDPDFSPLEDEGVVRKITEISDQYASGLIQPLSRLLIVDRMLVTGSKPDSLSEAATTSNQNALGFRNRKCDRLP